MVEVQVEGRTGSSLRYDKVEQDLCVKLSVSTETAKTAARQCHVIKLVVVAPTASLNPYPPATTHLLAGRS